MKHLERGLLVALSLLTLVTFDTVSERLKATYFNVPAGIIFYSKVSSCPAGWTEETAARGRAIVGLVSGGTLSGTAGTALSNIENRVVGQHTHAQDSHNHIQDSHNHTQDAHTHTQNSHNHTQNAHDHSFTTFGGSAELVNIVGSSPVDVLDNSGTTNTSSETATNNPATATNQPQTATNQPQTATNQSQTATNQNAGSVAGTNVPYIQLMGCRKL